MSEVHAIERDALLAAEKRVKELEIENRELKKLLRKTMDALKPFSELCQDWFEYAEGILKHPQYDDWFKTRVDTHNLLWHLVGAWRLRADVITLFEDSDLFTKSSRTSTLKTSE